MIDLIKYFGNNFLRGKLTYVVATLGLVGAVALLIQGQISEESFIFIVNAEFAIIGIRRAIGNTTE